MTYALFPKTLEPITNKMNLNNRQPCDPQQMIGTYSLQIGNYTIALPPTDWQGAPTYKKIGNKTELECYPIINYMDMGNKTTNLFFLGDRTMRRYYTVFDRDNHRIGLAKSAHL